MACGCPVVVSNVGAVPDLVQSGINGFIVDLDSWDWKGNVLKALTHDWDRQMIAQNMTNMSWDVCAEEVVETYNQAISGAALDTPIPNKTRPLKIIYHHRTLGDGAEGIHIREMIKAFRSLDHQVKVVGPVGESSPEQSSRGGVLSKIKSMLPGWLFELCEFGYTLYSFLQMSWKIRTEQPNFIYDRYITFNAGCVLAAKLQGVPIFLEVNAPLALERSEQPDEKLFFRKIAFFIERWTCVNSFRTIVVSTPLKKYLQSIGVPEARVVIMPNGVDPGKFSPQPKDKELLKALGIGAESIVIGFTGVLRPWHGVDD
jgi:glycosyltransferase involved in cell wall biosynthesis